MRASAQAKLMQVIIWPSRDIFRVQNEALLNTQLFVVLDPQSLPVVQFGTEH